jgi:acyl-CoA synthetase (AMP-forming)/AMP-acid ligase II
LATVFCLSVRAQTINVLVPDQARAQAVLQAARGNAQQRTAPSAIALVDPLGGNAGGDCKCLPIPIVAWLRCRESGDLTSIRHFLSEHETEGRKGIDDGRYIATSTVRVDADEVAVIMYTSGTTGRAKGAMLTHGNFWWNNTNAMHNFDVLANDVTLAAAPLFHIGGLNVITLVTLQKGGLVLLHHSFDPALALADGQRHRVTTMFGVPAMFQFMAQHPSFADTDL